MKQEKKNYIFGPIPSRRIGLSLGVDIVPFKTCTLNCVYCQLGRTAHTTLERKSHVPVPDLMEQLRQRLLELPNVDYITFSGSGEPTLNSDIGEIISSIKKLTNIPIAALTNGSLLWDKQVRADLMGTDLVIPSLDAGTPEVFRRINRPHPGLDFENIVRGLVEFRTVYQGQIWLEVFLLDGVNTMESELLKIREYADAMRADRIQLNTVARPPAEESALKVSQEDMIRICSLFGERAEVIAPYHKDSAPRKGVVGSKEVLAMLRRRPCTVEDIASGLGIHRIEVIKHLEKYEKQNALRRFSSDNKEYYQVLENET